MRVVGIAGSLRAGSFNRALLRAAVELAPPELTLEPWDIRDIPPYDGDLDGDPGPEPVAALRAAIAAADGLYLVTPEYNWGIPGVLKNAIDWASRPAATSSLVRKPAAIAGVAGGPSATARAQAQLRQVLAFPQMPVLPGPHVAVGGASEKFDADLRLVDEATRDQVAAQLAAFADWIRLVGT